MNNLITIFNDIFEKGSARGNESAKIDFSICLSCSIKVLRATKDQKTVSFFLRIFECMFA